MRWPMGLVLGETPVGRRTVKDSFRILPGFWAANVKATLTLTGTAAEVERLELQVACDRLKVLSKGFECQLSLKIADRPVLRQSSITSFFATPQARRNPYRDPPAGH